MKTRQLQKIGGAAFIIGAVLLALWTFLWSLLLPVSLAETDFTALVLDSEWFGINLMALAGLIPLLFGVSAVYSRISGKSGWLGLVGYVLLETALLIEMAKVTWEVFIYPVLAVSAVTVLKDRLLINSPAVTALQITGLATILTGVVLFAMAMIRSREFSPMPPVLFLTGAILYGVGPLLSVWIAIAGVMIFAAGCVLIGLRLILTPPGRTA